MFLIALLAGALVLHIILSLLGTIIAKILSWTLALIGMICGFALKVVCWPLNTLLNLLGG